MITPDEREAIDRRLTLSQQQVLLHYCGLLGYERSIRRLALAPRKKVEDASGLRIYRED